VLAPHYRTVALSLRGHGDSERGEQPGFPQDLLARDLECAIDALGAPRLVLVGHSLGGRVCMQYAAEHPEKMAGLVIVDAGPELDGRGVARIRDDARKQGGDAARGFGSPAEYARVLERQYPAAHPSTLARLAAHWLRRREDGRYELKLDLRPRAEPANGAVSRTPTWEQLRRIPCPALVVRGAASDVLSQDVAERMVSEGLPRAQLRVIPRASHSVMLDNPAAFGEALSDFVLG
jgi:pimeloyl-ACP methyl ester carboxylesterase